MNFMNVTQLKLTKVLLSTFVDLLNENVWKPITVNDCISKNTLSIAHIKTHDGLVR